MRTTVDKLTLRRCTAIVRITYAAEQLAAAGQTGNGTVTEAWTVRAATLEEARERILKQARREFPRAGLVIKCLTMHGQPKQEGASR